MEGFDRKSIDVNNDHAISHFSRAFESIFRKYYDSSFNDIVIFCIGTDRSTGDCLGPLVGHKLKLILYKNVHVYGTLDEPVHDKNLTEVLAKIKRKHDRPFIIAIDACLGRLDRVGRINIAKGPLRPGAGVNKNLPKVGHMHIVGIVNISGFMEYIILQNTRLSLVMRMADTISSGIHFNIWKYLAREDPDKISADL